MGSKAEVKKAISLYRGRGFSSLFARIRFWDAPFIEVERIVPKEGFIVDLGCGEGIFTNFLALSSFDRKILGVEIDKKRISQADHKLPNISFKLGDAAKVDIPMTDAIVLFDLLHHLPSYGAQEQLIRLCRQKLKNKGSLIVVEVGRKPFLKYLLSWVTDAIVVPMLFEKKFFSTKFFYRSADEWKDLFTRNGFQVKTMEAHKGKPFSHVIFECKI